MFMTQLKVWSAFFSSSSFHFTDAFSSLAQVGVLTVRRTNRSSVKWPVLFRPLGKQQRLHLCFLLTITGECPRRTEFRSIFLRAREPFSLLWVCGFYTQFSLRQDNLLFINLFLDSGKLWIMLSDSIWFD